jgi:hypothetical protein
MVIVDDCQKQDGQIKYGTHLADWQIKYGTHLADWQNVADLERNEQAV